MAVESKPLFHLEVLRQQVREFRLPERVTALLPCSTAYHQTFRSSVHRGPVGGLVFSHAT